MLDKLAEYYNSITDINRVTPETIENGLNIIKEYTGADSVEIIENISIRDGEILRTTNRELLVIVKGYLEGEVVLPAGKILFLFCHMKGISSDENHQSFGCTG